ncbi:hypothetical protein [Fischerella sp. JS2]|uniref:hypothetical protein n=1 Tax=Fischerella sp. JS2 TaxID=2597771 RepID=UPI0028ED888A|nr:hypothetical protein [Fischerella sp. JS2]
MPYSSSLSDKEWERLGAVVVLDKAIEELSKLKVVWFLASEFKINPWVADYGL